MTTSWEEIAKNKRESVYNNIPEKWRLQNIPSAEDEPNCVKFLEGLSSKLELEILNSTIIGLQKKIGSGELSSVEVTEIFCKRAAHLHQLTNCCSEIFFDKALERAKELDVFFSKNGKVTGPLHGIPISLKDQVNLEGLDSAVGYVSLVNKPKSKDDESNLAKILSNLGAVFYVKTTTPTAMMSPETVSNIYGPTTNSLNRKVSCGGSSGGEGALIGGKGSLLGFGTDIGGSIRLPSSVQGLYGLRATSNRIPYCKVTNSMADAPMHCSVIGPMASDLQDMKLITKLIIDSEPWLDDPKCPPIPWKEIHIKRKISIGIIDVTRYSYIHPPIKRAMEMVKEALLKSGHDVIDFIPPTSLLDIADISSKILLADGLQEISNECCNSGEPIRPELLGINADGTLPKECTISEYFHYSGMKYKYQQEFDAHWKSTSKLTSTGNPVDGVILPVNVWSAIRNGDSKIFSIYCTKAFNLLDYPAVTVPVTKADKNIDLIETKYVPFNEKDERTWKYYDPELCHGTPATIQIVTNHYEEEKAINLAEILLSSLESSA